MRAKDQPVIGISRSVPCPPPKSPYWVDSLPSAAVVAKPGGTCPNVDRRSFPTLRKP